MSEYITNALVIVFLILLNGIFAMVEIAVVSSKRSRIEVLSKTSKSAQIALGLKNDPGSFLSTIQIGITIIGIISGVFGGQKFAEPLAVVLNRIPGFSGYAHAVAFGSIVVVITYLSIVFGELIPKRIAISKPEAVALLLARPVRFLSQAARPFVFLLNASTKAMFRLFGHEESNDTSITEEEIRTIMKQGLDEGAIDAFEHKLFQKALKFGDRQAGVIMTPRLEVTYLDLKDGNETNIRKILDNPHRYYPVFDGRLDNFKGIIDAKDAFAQHVQNDKFDLNKLIKEAPCVIEENFGPELLEEFKKYKTHIAIVIDEYGMMQGIITLVDLFETLVGAIPQQQNKSACKLVKQGDGALLCDGLTPMDDVEDALKQSIIDAFPEADFNTLAGFVLMQLGSVPKPGQSVGWNGYTFKITEMDGLRISKIQITKAESPDGRPISS